MNILSKFRYISIACCLGICAGGGFTTGNAIGQTNYTVGTGYGTNHTAHLFAPFGWEGDWGNLEYHDHVSVASDGSSGQQYFWPDLQIEDNYGPYADHGTCTLDEFYYLIHDYPYEMGTLLISSHGHDNKVATDVFARVPAAYDYWYGASDWYDMWYDISSFYVEEQGEYLIIGATDEFIQLYGDLGQSLVYLNTDYGATLTDDFVAAGARVALGNIDSTVISVYRTRVDSFFTRMDGQSGRENRPASAARDNLTLSAAGALNTTLAPAIINVTGPDTMQVGDKMLIHLDTKCNPSDFFPYWCDWCDIDSIQMVDSTTIQAVLTRTPISFPDECTFYLDWIGVRSGRNHAYLDGNTNPYGAGNAVGPAHDDYEWTKPVKPCNCDGWTGDLDCSYTLNPVDVVIMVNYVYRNLDARCYPIGWSCPKDLGDVNSDGAVNVVDVVNYVNHVYKHWMPFPLYMDPCVYLHREICVR